MNSLELILVVCAVAIPISVYIYFTIENSSTSCNLLYDIRECLEEIRATLSEKE